MSTFRVTGKVTFISGVETFGAGKQSIRVIVCTEGNYPNYFPVTFYGDKMAAVDGWKVGDYVDIDTYPGGRLSKDDSTKAFTYLNGWAAVKLHGNTQAPPPNVPSPAPQPPQQPQQAAFSDDVPF